MYPLLWLFFIYAFLGWCTEVSYAALKSGRFVNRGFLNGPVCPVYGCGAVIVLWVLEPLRGNLLLLFLGSVALTSLLEWLTGFVLERLFHQRWWDYSQEPFNLNGYICLRFSIAWGLACLFVVKLVHPSVLWCIRTIPHPVGVGLLILFSVTMAVDLAATVRTIARINRQLRNWMIYGRCWLPTERSSRMAWRRCGTPWPSAGSSSRWTRQSGWSSVNVSCVLCGPGWMRSDRAASSVRDVCCGPSRGCGPLPISPPWSVCAAGWSAAETESCVFDYGVIA